jgi:hypothetical protein
MTRQKKEKVAEFDPNEFPVLKEFFSGYLHEDFNDEYGSAPGAARAFRGDASPEESAQACQEWTKLRQILTGRCKNWVALGGHRIGTSSIAWMQRSPGRCRNRPAKITSLSLHWKRPRYAIQPLGRFSRNI